MKVLIVDDSVVFRSAITKALTGVEGIEIYKSVSNGKVALDELKSQDDIDLITLDMEMPIMDGMETVREIRKFNKSVKIIIFSSYTMQGAEKTIEVLGLGANDFVTKTKGKGTIDDSIRMIREELVPKIQALLKVRNKIQEVLGRKTETSQAESITSNGHSLSNVDDILSEINNKPDLLLIASSTGGPNALIELFSSFNEEISMPMLLVQHMPPLFTTKLAAAISMKSKVKVKEAKVGDKLEKGVCYMAPGDYHMTLNLNLSLSLDQSEKVCFVRPSADVLFDSVAENFKGNILCLVLTGMGEDGANGCDRLKEFNANLVVQDEESSIVWGMPGAVIRAGHNPYILTVKKMADLINKLNKQ